MRVRVDNLRKKQQDTAVLPEDMEPLMGIVEVASYLRVPVATVRKWNHLGTGPRPLKIGRYVRYEPAVVREWVDGRRSAR
ncbi:MAG TPA: helix-turn-helix domain-containing protein [Actinomycetota bacterium]|nr:helix-turn-helix domain-containing protein [Actinomycetota bacterium]